MKIEVVQNTFQRKETKYILEKETFKLVEKELLEHMTTDKFAKSTITNIYFDNNNFDMIQDSIEKKYGREKIRMRTYVASPNMQSEAFLEVKKKENKVTYKYRVTSTPMSIIGYIENDKLDNTLEDEQLNLELRNLKGRYGNIKPMMYIYYDRVSFRGIEDSKVRVTVDKNLLYRAHNLEITEGKFGSELLDHNKVIMEVKVENELPFWLENILEKYGIEKQSFSKYGNAYKLHQNNKLNRGDLNGTI